MDLKNQKIGGFTEEELNKAYWWLTHKALIIKIITGCLIGICVVFWLYTFYGLIKYLFIDYLPAARSEKELTASYIDYNFFREKNKPQQLQTSEVRVFNLGNNRYDFVMSISNPNERWQVASLEYNFSFTGQDKPDTRKTFVLPGQSKYLVALGVESETSPTNVKLEAKIDWQRIKDVVEYKNFAAEALNLVVDKIEFVPGTTANGVTTSKTKFVITNKSPYNFWQAPFFVVLHQGGSIGAVSYVTKDNFLSGQTGNFEVVWYQSVASPDSTEIIPDINILDPAVFQPYHDGSGEPK